MLHIYLATLDSEEERTSLEKIYNDHKSAMLSAALSVVRKQEKAEDAVQDAIISLIKHKDDLFQLPHSQLRSKLVIFTKNKCIDMLRKDNRIHDVQIDDMEDVIGTGGASLEDQVILSDEYETMKKKIAALDEPSRLVLEMRYILDMTYKEIGEEMGITAKHVDTKIMRAKEKVRKLIEKRGGQIER